MGMHSSELVSRFLRMWVDCWSNRSVLLAGVKLNRGPQELVVHIVPPEGTTARGPEFTGPLACYATDLHYSFNSCMILIAGLFASKNRLLLRNNPPAKNRARRLRPSGGPGLLLSTWTGGPSGF